MATVYIITNTENEKVYIGSTTQSLATRFREHKSRANKGVKRYLVYDEMRRIGFDKFSISPLIENVSKEDLLKAEIEAIKSYEPKENLLNTNYGLSFSDIDYIVKAYLSGKKVKEIAKERGHCSKSVSRVLKEQGVELLDWNEYQKIKITDEDLKRMYVEEFMTTTEIAAVYNTSPQTIRKHLIKANIPLRKAVKRQYLNTMPHQSETAD